MDVELFAGIAVSDFDRATAWYERLLGTPATFEAHATEHVWTVADHRSIYVELRPDRAGHAMVTLFVDDLDGVVQAAADRGIHPETRETYGNGVRKVVYLDPDGNEIGFGGAPVR
jgi:catechol 2,3-dioxygenase-like lactoylglutathione lyase family enzyme